MTGSRVFDKTLGYRISSSGRLHLMNSRNAYSRWRDTGTRQFMHSVLVVDDYADTRELLYAVLSDSGYDVLLAADGAEGVRLARDTRPAVIIMDVFMPGMDGIEATRHIRAQPETAHTRVIAYTARYPPVAAKNELFDAICPKPCSPDELLALIRDVVPSH